MWHLIKSFLEIEVYQIHGFALVVFLVDMAEKLQVVGQLSEIIFSLVLHAADVKLIGR